MSCLACPLQDESLFTNSPFHSILRCLLPSQNPPEKYFHPKTCQVQGNMIWRRHSFFNVDSAMNIHDPYSGLHVVAFIWLTFTLI